MRELIKSARGNALVTVMVGAAVLGAGALMLTRSGLQRGKLSADMNQNTLIENTMLDLKTYLAQEANCKAALASNFSIIGDYTVGKKLGNGVSIERITDKNPGAKQKEILVVFKKDQGRKVASRRPDSLMVQTFTVPDPADPSGKATLETCTSFEADGISEGIKEFCDSIGGSYDPATGLCNPDFSKDAAFKEDVKRTACEVLGGSYTGTDCNGISIGGNILAEHIQLGNIKLGATSKTNSKDQSCAPDEVAKQVLSDGSIVCAKLVCPSPGPGYFSTFLPRVVGDELFCECQRDRGASIACGETDSSACEDYLADDGCGGSCVIYGDPDACASDPDQVPTCSDSTWSPAKSTVCNGVSFSQTSNCGNTRNATGTKSCASTCIDGQTRKYSAWDFSQCCKQWYGGKAGQPKTCSEPGNGMQKCVKGSWEPYCGL